MPIAEKEDQQEACAKSLLPVKQCIRILKFLFLNSELNISNFSFSASLE